jgi:hypothetical protein
MIIDNLPSWGETDQPAKTCKPSPYKVCLSSNLSDSRFDVEVVLAEVEPYGAVSFYRFTSEREVQHFDLTAAEVDALIATNRRRKSLIKRNQAALLADPDGSLGDLEDHPF